MTASTHDATPAEPAPPKGRGWMAAFAVATLVVGVLATSMVLRERVGPAQTFLEVYVTDLPADFERLDVRVAGVYVGASQTPLRVERPNFNLLALQGPSDALRIAGGFVPAGNQDEIRIVFERARAELDRKPILAEIPKEELVISHQFRLTASQPHALLFDIDVNESLAVEGASLVFRPSVAAIYHAFGQFGATASDEPSPSRAPAQPDFGAAPAQKPQDQRLAPASPSHQPRSPWTTRPAPETTPTYATYREEQPYHNDTGANPSTNGTDEGRSDPLPTLGEANSVPEDYARTIVGWFVQFVPEVNDTTSMNEVLAQYQAEVEYRFGSQPAAYLLATPPQAEDIYYDEAVAWLEPDAPVDLLLASSKPAIRLPEVQNPLTGLRDASGNPIDGRGVGVAVIDSGIDGLHPDLTHRIIEGAVAPLIRNFKVQSISLVDQVYTDTTSGHGTHVAGIVAGQGKKDVNMRGVAPGVRLYGFGIGEAATMLWPNQALDWISLYGAQENPPIRVVTNSWGTMGDFEPNSLTTRLVNDLVAKGIVVVFSAGNDGLKPAPSTTRECRNPTPGVICVGAYDDYNVGNRNGEVPGFSARGSSGDASTWPDLVGPGKVIRSTRSPFGWVTGVGLLDYYVVLDGTSMAAPHVAGTAALMLQAKSTLSPAQVEQILETSAHKFGGHDYIGGSHPAKGAGLLDAYVAVQTARST